MEKDPKKRLRDIGEALYLIDDAAVTAPPLSRFGKLPWIAAAVLAVIALGVSFIHFRDTPPAQKSVRFEIPPPARSQFSMFKLSPDGCIIRIVRLKSRLA